MTHAAAAGHPLRTAVRRKRGGALGLLSIASGLAAPAASADTHVLILAGLGGEQQYEERFRSEAAALAQAAEKLSGDPARVTLLSAAKADREAVRRELRALAGKTRREDQVMVVLLGHGTYDGEEYRFNLPGADLTGSEIGALLDQLPAREQLIVNATSASGAALERWKRAERVVIAATKNGSERTATRFAKYWLEAVSSSVADTNRDDVVTAAEAFEFANRRVAESFKADVSLATEHARLEGSGAPRWPVARFVGNAVLATADAALSTLYTQRVGIERDLEAIKQRKPALQADAYYDQLEEVLVRLATLQTQIDARQAALGGGKP